MINFKLSRYPLLITFLLFATTAVSQNEKQKKMKQLSFMVGEWIGTSKSFEDGKLKSEVSAFQRISYDLDSSIIVIELNSESLQLHTIIYFDEKDQTYYYNPFSKRGAGKYPAEFKEGQLIVKSSGERRYIFGRTSDGGFREYGEQLIDGEWVMYFEDTFQNSQ
jgi:hypothetical protein